MAVPRGQCNHHCRDEGSGRGASPRAKLAGDGTDGPHVTKLTSGEMYMASEGCCDSMERGGISPPTSAQLATAMPGSHHGY